MDNLNFCEMLLRGFIFAIGSTVFAAILYLSLYLVTKAILKNQCEKVKSHALTCFKQLKDLTNDPSSHGTIPEIDESDYLYTLSSKVSGYFFFINTDTHAYYLQESLKQYRELKFESMDYYPNEHDYKFENTLLKLYRHSRIILANVEMTCSSDKSLPSKLNTSKGFKAYFKI